MEEVVGGGRGRGGGDRRVILGSLAARTVSCSGCGYAVPVKHGVRQLNTGTSAGSTGIAAGAARPVPARPPFITPPDS